LSNLTHLRLSRNSSQYALDHFLKTLKGMQQLEVLHFASSFPGIFTRDASTLPEIPVLLPKLRTLDMHGVGNLIDELANVLRFIVIPSATLVNLSTGAKYQPFNSMPPVPTNSIELDRGFVSLKSLRVNFLDRYLMEIWDKGVGISRTRLLQLYLKIPLTVEPPMALHDLVTLIVYISISTDELIQLFGSQPHLRNIIVSGESVFDVILALMHKLPESDALQSMPTADSVTFPALRSLTIRKTHYRIPFEPGAEVDLLLRCIKERRNRNASLDELQILSCKHVRESDLKSLQEVVNVRWEPAPTPTL